MDTFTGMEQQLNGSRARHAEELAEVVRQEHLWAGRAVRRYAGTTEDPDAVTEYLCEALGLAAP